MTDDNYLLNRLIYRDALILIINKPSGIPVHKGTGGGITLDDYFESLRFGLPQKPMLGHRLDKDTSGCLVLGRHASALRTLGQIFANNRAEKCYWAVVEGIPAAPDGVIDLPLAKQSPHKHLWRMKVDDAGQPSSTRYRLLATHGNESLVAMEPVTGRTHQLRVHSAAMGWPIKGDGVYGNRPKGDNTPLHLHAHSISLPLYNKKPPIFAQAPLPPHIASWCATAGIETPAPGITLADSSPVTTK